MTKSQENKEQPILSEEEIALMEFNLKFSGGSSRFDQIVRAIEAAVREKILTQAAEKAGSVMDRRIRSDSDKYGHSQAVKDSILHLKIKK